MNKKLICSLSALSLMLTACATSKGFNRGELAKQIGVETPEVTDKEIGQILKRKANLPKHFKIAVYFKPQSSGRYNESKWRWTESDREIIQHVEADLKKQNMDAEAFLLSETVPDSKDLRALRVAAARHGADALMIIGGASDIDRYGNKMTPSYLLLVTALFVPGSEVDALFMANASLWDVRNEFLYMTSETEAITHETYVAAFGKEDEVLVNQSKVAALGKLRGEVVNMIRGMKE